MQNYFHAKISPIGNSEGVRLPKVLIHSLGTKEVVLEQTPEGILIKPAFKTPPLSEWTAIMEKMAVAPEPEGAEWDVTLSDGLDPWED